MLPPPFPPPPLPAGAPPLMPQPQVPLPPMPPPQPGVRGWPGMFQPGPPPPFHPPLPGEPMPGMHGPLLGPGAAPYGPAVGPHGCLGPGWGAGVDPALRVPRLRPFHLFAGPPPGYQPRAQNRKRGELPVFS
eukprot:616158-Rhodomonas_salina.2